MVSVFIHAEDQYMADALLLGAKRYTSRQGLDWPIRMLAQDQDGVMPYQGRALLLGWRLWNDLYRKTTECGWLAAELSQCDVTRRSNVIHVWPDDHMIGQVAARSLVEAGYRHVLLPGPTGDPNPIRDRRHHGLIDNLNARGISHELLDLPVSTQDQAGLRRLRAALQSVAGPVALFTHQDREALWYHSVLQQAGFDLPHDLGIMGVDDSPAAASAELTSVRVDWSMLTDRALQILHRQLAGHESLPATLRVPVCVVSERASTQTCLIGDPIIRRAHRLIRRSLPKGLKAKELARRLKLTDNQLAWYCRQAMGTPPGRWIVQLRLQCVCDHLTRTQASIDDIAKLCGFVNASHLSRQFKRAYGRTPGQFRQGL